MVLNAQVRYIAKESHVFSPKALQQKTLSRFKKLNMQFFRDVYNYSHVLKRFNDTKNHFF